MYTIEKARKRAENTRKSHALAITAAAAIAVLASAAGATAQQINFDGNVLPCITFNIATAQNAGQPAVLTRTSAQQAAANRTASCGPAGPTVAQMNNFAGATVFSCDEYPFASTTQGGATAQVMIVPLIENNIQGGQLSAFYNANGVGIGTNFTVGVVNVPNPGQLNLGNVNGYNVCYGGR